MYADFEYYKNSFYGTEITEEEFPQYAERASGYIDYITRGKATDIDAVKKATCAIADHYYIASKANAATMNGTKASESVGSWSVSYRDTTQTAASIESGAYAIATRYLAHTGLLYRGTSCRGCCL